MINSKIIVKNLHKSFMQGGKVLNVLQGIDAEFEQGKGYAITGVSGSGKSTLLHLLGSLDMPSSGTVFFNEKDLFKISHREKDSLLNNILGFIFQFHYLIKELTVLENIILKGLIKGDSRNFCKKRALEFLDVVQLTEKADSFPTQLSGGQQQRVAILRAVFNKPKFLLADEPTGNLDADNALLIVDLLLKFKKEWNMGIVLCSHDSAVSAKMDYLLKLQNGLLTSLKSK